MVQQYHDYSLLHCTTFDISRQFLSKVHYFGCFHLKPKILESFQQFLLMELMDFSIVILKGFLKYSLLQS